MANRRKPLHRHATEGTLRPRHSAWGQPPVVTGSLGGPPGYFGDKPRAIWGEIVDLLPPGVAAKADRLVVELLCVLVHRMREDARALTPAMASQMRGCLASLGLSPVDRHRVSVKPDLPADSVEAEKFFSDRPGDK